jgi:hypothetical protein
MGMLLRRHAEQREARGAAELEALRAENERAAAVERAEAEAQASAELEAARVVNETSAAEGQGTGEGSSSAELEPAPVVAEADTEPAAPEPSRSHDQGKRRR